MVYIKTKLNPIIPLGRLLFTLILGSGVLVSFWAFFYGINSFFSEGWKLIVGFPTVTLLMAYMAYTFGKQFFSKTRTFIISDEEIEIKNLLNGEIEVISKEEVKGFSICFIPTRIGKVKEIIIYLYNNRKIELTQFDYFNFKKIENTLTNLNYPYLGVEPIVRKWYFGKRIYKFEKL